MTMSKSCACRQGANADVDRDQSDVDASRLKKYVPDSDRDGQTRCFGKGSNLVLSLETAGGRKARGTDQNACRQSSLESALL